MFTPEEKQLRAKARKEARAKAKESARIESERNQKPVKELTISIEWRKSRTWGMNPHATAKIHYHDGTYGTYGYIDNVTCSGCGYDKESTVIAKIFNACLKYKLWTSKSKLSFCNSDDYRCYDGWGANFYKEVAKEIGGSFKRLAGGKMFDVYQYIDGDGK